MSGVLDEKEKLRLKVVRLHNQNLNDNTITRKLKVTPKFVSNTLLKLNDIGSIKDRPRSGRPSKLTASDKKRLVKQAKGHERRSSRKIAATFKTSESEKIGRNTVRLNLKKQGLIPHRKKRRPKLTQKQKEKRVAFAKKYRRKDWSKTAFWDEKLFELDHSPNPKNDIIWDERGAEYFKEAEKYPAKVMIGVAITSRGPSRVVMYHGKVDAQTFLDNIEGPVSDINKKYKGEKWEWIMDHASIHKAKLTQRWLTANVPVVFPWNEWAVNSPDLSAIKNLFGDIQDIVDQKSPKDLDSLKRIIKAEFKNLTPEKCQKFISALPSRLVNIIESQGEYCYD